MRKGNEVHLRSPRSGLMDATQWDAASGGGAPREELTGWHAATAAAERKVRAGSRDGKLQKHTQSWLHVAGGGCREALALGTQRLRWYLSLTPSVCRHRCHRSRIIRAVPLQQARARRARQRPPRARARSGGFSLAASGPCCAVPPRRDASGFGTSGKTERSPVTNAAPTSEPALCASAPGEPEVSVPPRQPCATPDCSPEIKRVKSPLYARVFLNLQRPDLQ